MDLATWWAGDPLIELPPLLDFQVGLPGDDVVLSRINQLTTRQVKARRQAGHRPYIGLKGVTYGWVATREAFIGEFNPGFRVRAGDRYLWDFATLPRWQGKGLYYPRLLQTIVQAEHARRFWIIPSPEMPASALEEGISRAGFDSVGQVSIQSDGKVGLIPLKEKVAASERALIGAALLGIPLLSLPATAS